MIGILLMDQIINAFFILRLFCRKPQYNMAIDLPLNLYHCAFEFLDDFEETTRLKNKTDQSHIKKDTIQHLNTDSNDRIETLKEITESETLTDSDFTSRKKVKNSSTNESQKDSICQIGRDVSEEVGDDSMFGVNREVILEENGEIIANSDRSKGEMRTTESTLKNVENEGTHFFIKLI